MTGETNPIEEPSYAWPQKGDQLIKADNDWWFNASIDWWNKDFGIYGDGYKKAADLLVDHIVEIRSGARNPIDYLIFPIAFLYRQYVELKLKEIIRLSNDISLVEDRAPTHHKLDELWSRVRTILEEESVSSEDLNVVGYCIAELVAVDPASTAFRYPFDKQGKDSIGQEQVQINVRNLKEIMTKLGNFFLGCSEAMYVKLQHLEEMRGYSSC